MSKWIYSEHSGKCVLVVEDDMSSYVLVEQIFRRIDPSILVECTDNVNDAAEMLAEGRVMLIISDHNLMGAKNGMDLWRHQLEAHPGMPFVMITGEDVNVIKTRDAVDGNTPYILQKPLRPHITQAVLEEVLRIIKLDEKKKSA